MLEALRLEDVLGKHEPEANGFHCSCQPVDGDEQREVLSGTWETHLAEAILKWYSAMLCSQCGERPAAMVKVGTTDGWCTVCLDEAAGGCQSRYRLPGHTPPMPEYEVGVLECLLRAPHPHHRHYYAMPDDPLRFWMWDDDQALVDPDA